MVAQETGHYTHKGLGGEKRVNVMITVALAPLFHVFSADSFEVSQRDAGPNSF